MSVQGRLAARVPGVRYLRRPGTHDAPAFDLAYVRTGPRAHTPVLVIPGGPGLASVLPSWPLRARAKRWGLDLIMVEHRGVGLSRRSVDGRALPPAAMRIEDVIEDLAATLEAEGVESAVVYGASYGSYLAAGFGALHPERVAAMVLDSPILTANDYLVERRYLRSLLWEGATEPSALPPGVPAALSAHVRALVAAGVDDTEVLECARAAVELGGPAFATRLLAARRRGRGRPLWWALHTYARRDRLPGPLLSHIYEFDVVGTIAFREMHYAPPLDGEEFDSAHTYRALAPRYPRFACEPFDLVRELPRFDWPTRILTGANDLRTPTEIADRAASLIPGAELCRLPGGHSALESNMTAALTHMNALARGLGPGR
ncbi:MAG: alpha/beta fold hydrolase [Dermabacter sp.]|nr:alpha/beta fold hydrolase [Dermabacter sp.]